MPAPPVNAFSPRVGREHGAVIPSLDGLRAVAITGVCICHLVGSGRVTSSSLWARIAGNLGDPGVRLFFVLSGFLITTLLVGEYERRGTIALRRFYYRRTLRIFPAYFAFLGLVVLLAGAGILAVHAGNALPAVFYVSDFLATGAFTFGHTWSLSVEEQFYLLWPLTMALAAPRRATWIALGAFLAAPPLRVITQLVLARHAYQIHGVTLMAPQYEFQGAFDALATGCLLALVRNRLHENRVYQRIIQSRASLVVAVALILANAAIPSNQPSRLLTLFNLVIAFPVMNLCTLICLDWCLSRSRGVVVTVLNTRPFVTVGILSYSIYLWQEVFFYHNWFARSFAWYQDTWASPLLVLLVAAGSYLLIETPFLIARRRLEPRLFPRAPVVPEAGPTERMAREL